MTKQSPRLTYKQTDLQNTWASLIKLIFGNVKNLGHTTLQGGVIPCKGYVFHHWKMYDKFSNLHQFPEQGKKHIQTRGKWMLTDGNVSRLECWNSCFSWKNLLSTYFFDKMMRSTLQSGATKDQSYTISAPRIISISSFSIFFSIISSLKCQSSKSTRVSQPFGISRAKGKSCPGSGGPFSTQQCNSSLLSSSSFRLRAKLSQSVDTTLAEG